MLSLTKSSDRMVKRSQPDLRSLPKRLCCQQRPAEASGTDPETFDDSDFYQQLLREFLEASNVGANLAAPAGQRRKLKPTRDRRGSKGRRLRYDVQASISTAASSYKAALPAIHIRKEKAMLPL